MVRWCGTRKHTTYMTTRRKPATVAHQALALHKQHQGKIALKSLVRATRATLGLLYTPGVGAVASFVAAHPESAKAYTSAGRFIAVVSDGSAVLGLGNIGPVGALPVMEGKALLFKELARIDAVPIVLTVHTADEIVAAVQAIAPSFAGINLEDIAAPVCFEVEERLKRTLTIPVMHDDQHGTAMVVLAGLMNACKVVGKSIARVRVAVIGAGAAGTAIAKLLLRAGVSDVVVVDRKGVVSATRTDLCPDKRDLALSTNREGRSGDVREAVAGADAVIGVSGPGTIHPEHIRIMAQHPIVFALANPVPEIMPEEAEAAGAAVVATGRSDFPNQINNALVFPGVFRGALDHGVQCITDDMQVRVARKLAALVTRPSVRLIIPSIFDRRVVSTVASAVR